MESDKSRIVVSVLLVVALVFASSMVTYSIRTTRYNQLMENSINQLTWLLRKKNLQIKTLVAQLENAKVDLDAANKNLASVKTDLESVDKKAQTAQVVADPAPTVLSGPAAARAK